LITAFEWVTPCSLQLKRAPYCEPAPLGRANHLFADTGVLALITEAS
jgi:hypothetical protein